MSFDLQGAASDLADRAKRYAPIYKAPSVEACIKLIHRNPVIAPAVLHAIEAEMAKIPGGGVGLDKPLRPGASPAA